MVLSMDLETRGCMVRELATDDTASVCPSEGLAAAGSMSAFQSRTVVSEDREWVNAQFRE